MLPLLISTLFVLVICCFHTWHVKRSKPEDLFGTELDKERYTEQLWIAEGFISYYYFSLIRCGLITVLEYLKLIGKVAPNDTIALDVIKQELCNSGLVNPFLHSSVCSYN